MFVDKISWKTAGLAISIIHTARSRANKVPLGMSRGTVRHVVTEIVRQT